MKSVPFLMAAGILLGILTGAAQVYSPAASSNTTLTASPATAYTGSPSNVVTLTAAVTPGATGSVTFQDTGVNLSCSGGNPAAISDGLAACVTSFSTQGMHVLSASYGGDRTFVSSTGSADVFTQDHASSIGTTYCNSGAVFANSKPYPSVIVVGDGVNSSISGTVSTLSLELVDFSAADSALNTTHLLLMAPDGVHAYDFLSGVGGNARVGNYFFDDGATQVPAASIGPGTYAPAAYGAAPRLFTLAPPAPQLPPSILYAPPAGNSTLGSAFSGVNTDGPWSLYMYDSGGASVPATAAGGWCLTITPATGRPTTTAVTSNPVPYAALGQSVTFTATVSSADTPSTGAVTFTENGRPLIGAPDGALVNLVNGVATISTIGLREGDHTVSASFHDATGSFNDSAGTMAMRVDKATSVPTVSVSTWTYCNTGAIGIPAGGASLGEIAPAQPNPSNISVTNLPGTISSMSLTLNRVTVASAAGEGLETMLAGPNGDSAPTPAQTLDFFSVGDFSVGSLAGAHFGPRSLEFSDNFQSASQTSAPADQAGPASYGDSARIYTASPFFKLPATFQYAAPRGEFTFATAGSGVYSGTNPNGTWSLYFGRNPHRIAGEVNGGWCLNFVENEVTGMGTTAGVGPSPNQRMVQGGSGSVNLSLRNEGDSKGNGSTGDPDGNHGMIVSGSLPAGLTLGAVPTGSPWNCTALNATSVSCQSESAVAAGSTYPLLTLPVNAVHSAPATATVSGFTFGGAGMSDGTFSPDTITIDPGPAIVGPGLLILTNPTNTTVIAGATATFTAQAIGTPAPTVQWQVSIDGGATFGSVSGATSTTLSFPATSNQNGNQYEAVFTNASGTATTTAGLLTVNLAPAVTSNPANQSVMTGSAATFTAAATGNPTPAVQWQVSTDGGATFTNVSSATSTTLSFMVSNTQNGNQYRAVFSNSAGTATTSAATLTVSQIPVILTNPTTTTVNAGATAKFTAQAIGTPTPTVQWQVSIDGGSTFSNVLGATSATLSFTAVSSQNSNQYLAVFTNASGSAITTTATLTVDFAPTVLTNPVSQSVGAGSTATFTAAAAANPTPAVQWQVSIDGGTTFTNVSSATSGTLSFTVSATQNGNQYRAVFSNSVGTAATTAGTLTVPQIPVVLTNPTATTVNAGTAASFTAAATGTPAPSVQWQVSVNGGSTFTNVQGATSTTLSFTAASSQNGNKFRVVFSNTSGSATTTAATLSVDFAPTLTANPVNQVVPPGSTATFTATAAGNPAPTVQWQMSIDGGSTFTNVSAATSGTLSFTASITQTGNQYRAVFTNSLGTATTAAATLTVGSAPVISASPTNTTVNVGATATFTAAATGNPTPTVQWQVSANGGSTFTNVSGATTTTLSFTAASGQNGNQYRALFSNAAGSATTPVATLAVNFAPTVTANPANLTASVGSTATFIAAGSGGPTPTVQWQVSTNGGSTFTYLPGTTSATLSFTAAATQSGNRYRAVFGNFLGTAATTAATLTVTAPAGPCGLQQTESVTVADVQLLVNEAMGVSTASYDLNGDGWVNVVDVQIEIDAALGLGCSAS